jgi:hypothetical protein
LWKSPFARADTLQMLPLTPFREREQKQREVFSLSGPIPSEATASFTDRHNRPYKNFVFDEDFRSGQAEWAADGAAQVVLPPEKRFSSDGSYKIRPYRHKFSLDYAGGAGGYDPFFGVQGYTQLYLSDLAGNQQIGVGLNIIQSLENSDLLLGWSNIAPRLDYGVTLFHVVNFFQTQFGLERIRNLGVNLAFSYPLSRFKRFELNASLTQLRDDNLYFIDLPTKVTNALPITLAYVSDNTLFRFFGPFTGTRYRASVIAAPSIGSKSRTFQAGLVDFRHYFGITRDIGFAWRVSGGASGGRNPMRFLLGGVDNWLDREFASNLDTAKIADFYFSNFVTPLRGADYYERVGTRYFLLNVELRFPLVDYFITRFPLPLGIAGIRGAGFLDVGSAWSSDKRFRATQKNEEGQTVLRDIIAGYGWGFRANLGIFLLRMDAVWRTNLAHSQPPEYLFSFGTDF